MIPEVAGKDESAGGVAGDEAVFVSGHGKVLCQFSVAVAQARRLPWYP
jgi:hypothetical protein